MTACEESPCLDRPMTTGVPTAGCLYEDRNAMCLIWIWRVYLPHGALLCLLTSSLLQAQGNRASITGTVIDPSNAVVVGVDVTAKNLGTGVETGGSTNNDGIYSILNLFPGDYSLKFSKGGFQTIELQSITLLSTQVAKIDERMAVATTTQTVTVTAPSPILDTETGTQGTHLTGQVVTDLPLNASGGRQIEQFAYALTPGYSAQSNTYDAVVNGTQGFTKDFTIDGTSGTAQIQGDSIEIGPSMEAIQEVESQTSGISAQNGITNGGVIMFNIKSGTNQFHGSGFVYGHNEILDARVWGNPEKPESRFWNYGGSVGGPIRKDRTFFFGAFERYQQNDFTLSTLGTNSGAATVPTQAFLNGDFSALLDKTTLLGMDTHGQPIYPGAIFNPNDAGAVFPATASVVNIADFVGTGIFEQNTIRSSSPVMIRSNASLLFDRNSYEYLGRGVTEWQYGGEIFKGFRNYQQKSRQDQHGNEIHIEKSSVRPSVSVGSLPSVSFYDEVGGAASSCEQSHKWCLIAFVAASEVEHASRGEVAMLESVHAQFPGIEIQIAVDGQSLSNQHDSRNLRYNWNTGDIQVLFYSKERARALSLTQVPTLILVNPSGEIAWRGEGFTPPGELGLLLRSFVGDPAYAGMSSDR